MGTGHYAGCSCSACIDAERSDACRTCVTDSYFDEGFAAANYLRFCDSWIAIGLAMIVVEREMFEMLSDYGAVVDEMRDTAHKCALNRLRRDLGIPAAEAK